MTQVMPFSNSASTIEALTSNLSYLNSNESQSPKLSRKYVAINTAEMVENLLTYKFKDNTNMFKLRQVKREGKGANKYAHMVRLVTTKPLNMSDNSGEKLYPELVIYNSYDGSKSLVVEMGIFRLVCSNGLTIKTNDFGSLKIKHIGTPAKAAQDTVIEFVKAVPELSNVYSLLKERKLSDKEVQEFAWKALEIKEKSISEAGWLKKVKNQKEVLQRVAEGISKSRRTEDSENDLWSLFNRVQENIMVGGYNIDRTGLRQKVRSSRGIDHVRRTGKINSELIDLAMSYVNSERFAKTNANEYVEVTPCEVVDNTLN